MIFEKSTEGLLAFAEKVSLRWVRMDRKLPCLTAITYFIPSFVYYSEALTEQLR